MNRLMMMLNGDTRLMDGEPGTDGAPPATTTPTTTPTPETTTTTTTPPPETTTTTTTPPPATTTPTDDPNDLSKVTLGDGQQPPATTPPPANEINEDDYATKVTIDAEIANDVQVDQGAMKAVAPILKEAGISVETAGKLVNALARYQVEQFKARQQERFDDNKRMHDAAIQKYSKADFEQINAGIDAAFARDGVMNYIVRNSEIGNDLEFLELMKWYGSHHPTNTQPTGGGTGGGTTGQPAGFAGIAKSWE